MTTQSVLDRTDANLFAAVKAFGVPVGLDAAAQRANMSTDAAADAAERLVQRHVLRLFRPVSGGGLLFEPVKKPARA